MDSHCGGFTGWRHQTELGSLVRLITARLGTARHLKHSCLNNVTGLGRPSTGTPDSRQEGDLYADAGTHPVPWDETFNIGSHTGTPLDDQDYQVRSLVALDTPSTRRWGLFARLTVHILHEGANVASANCCTAIIAEI